MKIRKFILSLLYPKLDIVELEHTVMELEEETNLLADNINLCQQTMTDQSKEIADLKETIDAYQSLPNLIKKVFATKFEWYDYTELDKEMQRNYQLQASVLLKNPVFINEINFLFQNFAKKALDEAKDFQELNDMRQQALGLKALQSRIEEIPVPEDTVTKPEEPFAAV